MEDCVFCKIANHVFESAYVYEDEICTAFLDLSQTTYGHTLVVPKKHMTNILDADDQTLSHLIKVVAKLANQVTKAVHANGCNILTNANEAAGQTVMHLHFHIIPRFDENDGFQMNFANHEGMYDLNELANKIKNA